MQWNLQGCQGRRMGIPCTQLPGQHAVIFTRPVEKSFSPVFGG
jgi:hypothetical protein